MVSSIYSDTHSTKNVTGVTPGDTFCLGGIGVIQTPCHNTATPSRNGRIIREEGIPF